MRSRKTQRKKEDVEEEKEQNEEEQEQHQEWKEAQQWQRKEEPTNQPTGGGRGAAAAEGTGAGPHLLPSRVLQQFLDVDLFLLQPPLHQLRAVDADGL